MRMKMLSSALILCCGRAFAGGIAAHFDVQSIRIDASGKGYIQFASPLTNAPAACGTDFPNALAFDTNTVGGRSTYAAALSAKTLGAKMYARGTGACEIYGVIEDWSYGILE